MDSNTPQTNRNVDIVFCLDGTGSMSPCLDMVKQNAQKFYQDLLEKLTLEYNSSVDDICIKVIVFRDYLDDGDHAMIESEWFDMTAGDTDKYEAFLKGIVAEGGGVSLEENGLEALYYAMATDWNARNPKDRQVIVLFTDADALDLMDAQRKGLPNYPQNMVDRDGLVSMWECILPPFMAQGDLKLQKKCKRLVMYAPAGTKYEDLAKDLNRSQFIPVDLSAGLGDLNFDDVIRIIASSISSV
ncbi:MAG: VWA domain-containing protein [Clostridia bacterium]|nr:VWA domain-containing protein [Clostridia bacterium]